MQNASHQLAICTDAQHDASERIQAAYYLRELRLLAKLYILHPHFMYINYMANINSLSAAYLPDTVPASLVRWFPSPSDLAPDVCGTCLSVHGQVQGGRIRAGCYKCCDTCGKFGGYVRAQLAVQWKVSQELVEFLLAQIIQEVQEHVK